MASGLKRAVARMIFGSGETAVARFRGAANAVFNSSTDPATLEKASETFRLMSNNVQRLVDRAKASKQPLPRIASFDGKEQLDVHIDDPAAPWGSYPIGKNDIPGMIMDEEIQYYSYIGRFFRGKGKAVELGPWLGRSTHYIAEALAKNPNFAGQKLHVFDDFVWRTSWMNQHVPADMQLPNHASFEHFYNRYTAPFAQHLKTTRCKITDFDGNESLPQLTWNEGPIELLYVDCGRTMDANNGWFKALESAFVPDVTVIMMQDWGLHREIPAKWFNQTRQFSDSKGSKLQLIHDLRSGNIATFIYKG